MVISVIVKYNTVAKYNSLFQKKEKWIWTIKKLLMYDLIGKAVEYSLKGY